MDRFSETYPAAYTVGPSNACDNCEREVMEDLREVFEYRHGNHRFFACHECYDEIQADLEKQAEEELRRKTILAYEQLRSVRMYAQMYAALGGTRTCCECKTKEARWDSLYCSEECRKTFLTFPEVA